MFEAFTQKARKAIFFGRYEASEFGHSAIEMEHLLLGVVRADYDLALRIFQSAEKVRQVRERIEQEKPRSSDPVPLSVDLPLSSEVQNALKYAAESATRLDHRYVTVPHLLLGMLQEHTSLTSTVFAGSAVPIALLEAEARRASGDDQAERPDALPPHFVRKQPAPGDPLIGREREMAQMIQNLSRRTKSSVALIGEPGVGKDALVRGLMQRIADGDVPEHLLGREVLCIDALEAENVFSPNGVIPPFALEHRILYIHGLLDLRKSHPGLINLVKNGSVQLIATGSPLSLRLAAGSDNALVTEMSVVLVLPPTDEEAVKIVTGLKKRFEQFHKVVFSSEALSLAVTASGRFFRSVPLPIRALDLIDEAGALVKLRCSAKPPEIVRGERKIRQTARLLEAALKNHEQEKAKELSQMELDERENLRRLQDQIQNVPRSRTVESNDIVEVIAARLAIAPEHVKRTLQATTEVSPLEQVKHQIEARIPVARRDWVEGLVAYLADSSPEEIDRLSDAIKASKERLR